MMMTRVAAWAVLLLSVGVGAGCRSAGDDAPVAKAPAVAAPPPPPAPAAPAPADSGSGSGSGSGSSVLAAAVPCEPADTEAGTSGTQAPRDSMTLTATTYAELPGWTADHQAEAIPSFLKSCAQLAGLKDSAPVGVDGSGGKAKQWRAVCAAAAKVPPGDDAAARAMFEHEMTPYIAAGKTGPIGKLTAYDVQELHASKQRGGKYQTPVLGKPDDLVMMDLSLFAKDAHGRHIWGRVDKRGQIVPFYTRAEIRAGALDNKGLELMWVDDPVDLLFAQIEGSAKAVMDDGSTVWLEFAAKNGRAYRGVGSVLRGSGELPPGTGTMQGIRKWFKDHPARYNEIVDQDASYVFFKVSEKPGAIGSQGVVLTTKRSAAVDRAFVAQSTPLWIDGHAPVLGKPGTEPWQHLVIAQDTGGGIVGAVRADLYWGDDAEAAEVGGRMGGPGRIWLLLPHGVTR